MYGLATLKKLNEEAQETGKNQRLRVFENLARDLGKWDASQISEVEEAELWQELVDSGLAWNLHETYIAAIERAISKGLVEDKKVAYER